MNKPKTKKVKKYKYSREFLAEMFFEYKDKCDFIKDLLATQPQPIKEENKKEDPKEKTPRDCIVCGKTIYADYDSCINVCNQCANNKQEESKDIELPKNIKYLNSDLKRWVKQVTDTLNSLTKRNIK